MSDKETLENFAAAAEESVKPTAPAPLAAGTGSVIGGHAASGTPAIDALADFARRACEAQRRR